MIDLVSNTAVGFGIIMSIVIIAVMIYTVIRLRKQVHKTEKEEEKKNDLN